MTEEKLSYFENCMAISILGLPHKVKFAEFSHGMGN